MPPSPYQINSSFKTIILQQKLIKKKSNHRNTKNNPQTQ